jgi:deoxycytidine triphosphate deaminase
MATNRKDDMLFPDGSPSIGVLTDAEISSAVATGKLISRDTFVQSSLEASSYDVSVGGKGMVGGEGLEIDLSKEPMILGPGGYGGIISHERLNLPPEIYARIGSKRALSYEGVILLTGSIIDPGYEGHLLFGLYNASQRRVVIRQKRKICNIVFERLSSAPQKSATPDPSLQSGNFPDVFIDKMTNMEVLPWMQISERVKQIEDIAKDILDLKARYEDVLQPIRDLTANVRSLTDDVASLTSQTRSIASDVERVNHTADENAKAITQLTTNVATLVGQIQGVQDRTKNLEETDKAHLSTITGLQTSLGRFQLGNYVFWAIMILIIGALLGVFVPRLFQATAPQTPTTTQPANQ